MKKGLEDSIDRFLSESGFSESTQANYGRFIGYVIAWLAERDLDLAELQPAEFLRFLDAQDWGGNTRYHCWQAFKSYLRWMYGGDHPVLRLRVRRQQSPPQRTLTPKEVRRLLHIVGGSGMADRRNRAILMLMLDTGLRASEICDLQLSRLDLENRCLDVPAKGGKWRRAVFSEITRDALIDWLQLRGDFDGKVFVSERGICLGGSLSSSGLRWIFRELGRRAGISGFSPHVMRRTFATMATASGAPTRLVQVAGGWSSIDMVERYTQALQADDFQGYFPTEALLKQ